MANLAEITAAALVPDQLVDYVRAIAGLKSRGCGDFLLHWLDDSAVLVAYGDDFNVASLDAAVRETLADPKIKSVAVLAPEPPAAAPPNAKINRDNYWFLPLPAPAPNQKLRNILKTAASRYSVSQEPWSEDAGRLAADFRRRKNLDDATAYLFERLDVYLAACPLARLYAARDDEGSLRACAIADFSGLATAFYMFAFGAPNSPGSADLLLAAVIAEAENRGYEKINLGLGINPGIEFFKKKWGAKPALPLTETSWSVRRPGFFRRLFGK